METILLVEENGALRDQMAATLCDGGYTVISMPSSGEALTWSSTCDKPIHLLVSGARDLNVNQLRRHQSGMKVLHVAEFTGPLSPGALLQQVRATLDAPARKPVVLVVDDHAAIRRLLGRILVANGYEFLEAGDGRDAIDLVRRHGGRIDLLITDLVMPEAGGLDLTADLTREYPAVKVLYISGYWNSVAMDVIASHSPDAVLRKPFGEDMLLEKIRKLLGTE